VGERRVRLDVTALDGRPDGACADGDGGTWCCVLGSGRLVRTVGEGGADSEPAAILDPGVEQPSDVTFGGADLDRLYVVSIALQLGPVPITSPTAGALLRLDGTGVRGRPEPRFAKSG
jgi:sugar lactone lactonase YvrE